MIIKHFVSILLFLFSAVASAQDENTVISPATVREEAASKKEYYLFSPRVSISVPHPTGNASFKKSFVGIYEVSAGLNVFLYKGFFAGVTAKNGLLAITENKIADYNADMLINNAALKVGGDYYVSENNRVVLSLSLAMGYNSTNYSHLKWKNPNNPPLYTKFNTNYVEPEINLFFLIESNFGIGATVSYTIFNAHFDPYDLNLNEYAQYNTSNAVSTQFLSIGFGLYYSIFKRKFNL